jgi:glycerate-2-kinase
MKNDLYHQQATKIFHAVLRGVDPYDLTKTQINRILSSYRVGNFQRLIIISFGKAVFRMVSMKF